ncbi:MAG: 50S ribosomal protein L25 [Dehalococcoidia bacterium]
MAQNELSVAPRTVLGKKVAQLRRSGVTPANIYGHNVASKAVQGGTFAITHLFRGITRNAIIELKVAGEDAPRTVVVREVTRDPVSSQILHIDFYQVSLTERMRADVQVILVGTSPAVGTYGGVLLQTLDTVAVEALPADIPRQFEIDVSILEELESSIHVRDLRVDPAKVTLHTDLDVVLARVATPRLATEEEEAATAAAAAAAEEGAVPAEGEPTAADAKPAEAASG